MAKLTASQQQDIKNNFLHKLGARVRVTERYYAEPVYIPFSDFSHNYMTSAHVERYPIVEIEIPSHKFEQLAEQMNDFEDMRMRYGPNIDRMAMEVLGMESMHRREHRLRREYPALQKAWDNYQLVLKMVEGKHD